jgi:hypothetical protein
MGRYEQGWQELEWRWGIADSPHLSFPQPVWDGGPLAGKRICLWAEQGSGDTIQFVRFAEEAKRAGGTVILECQPSLVRLLRTCRGIDEIVPFGSPLPEFDVHAPLQSMPRILRTSSGAIPARTPYLAADAGLASECAARLDTSGCLRVGLVWAGSSENRNDGRRSIEAERFNCLRQVQGCAFYSLQKEDLPGDFADAAALVTNLDLVITVDTAAAHLAGALGKPVWTLLAFAADWRWMSGRDDSPWYPTMRLFRQSRPGDWDGVLARVAEALEPFRDEHRG